MKPRPITWFSAAEDAHLMRLVWQAFDLREGPYLRDAVEAIAEWHALTLPDRIERQDEAARRS